jgi:Flp pilus assembly protein TadD
MRRRWVRFSGLAILALAVAGSGRDLSPREELRFGVEAARQGLWREAVFRWERALKKDAENPRLRNNLAVAYESLGQFDRARQMYKDALDLDPQNKEIRDNFASFIELHPPPKESTPATGEEARPSDGL